MTNPYIIQRYKDKRGYWHDARSSCCGKGIVYYDSSLEMYLTWHGSPPVPDEPRCKWCNRLLEAKPCEP